MRCSSFFRVICSCKNNDFYIANIITMGELVIFLSKTNSINFQSKLITIKKAIALRQQLFNITKFFRIFKKKSLD